MTLQDRTTLTTTINTNIPVGTTKGVTATNHRQVEENLADGIWRLISTPITDTDSPYTLDVQATQILLTDSTAGAITVNLPSASSASGYVVYIKHNGSANTTTIDGDASETIDGATTKVLSTQYEVVKLYCDGTEWWIIGN